MLLAYIFMADGKEIYLGKTYEIIYEVLGEFSLFLIPYLLLSTFSDFIIDKDKRIIFLIRLYSFIVFLIFIYNLKLLFYANNLSVDDNLEKNIFKFLFVENDLGLLITMILFNSYFLIPLNLNIAITGIFLFISSFILFGKIIGNVIRGIFKYYSAENREIRKQRKLLLKEEERIRKRIIEKEKREKIEKEKRLKEEKIKKELIERRIAQLKEEIEQKKVYNKGEQLSFQEVEVNSLKIEEKAEKKNKEVEENQNNLKIPKEQLKLEFTEEEVENDTGI
jgi:hypothetical protein